MASKFDSPTDAALSDSPTLDRTGRYPRDAFLRAHGFEIRSRPNDGPTLWYCTETHRVMTEAEALAEAEWRCRKA